MELAGAPQAASDPPALSPRRASLEGSLLPGNLRPGRTAARRLPRRSGAAAAPLPDQAHPAGTVRSGRPGNQAGFEVVTSGSTGEPHRVFRTDRNQAQISAVWDRLFVAFGRRRRDRQVNIGSGRPIGKQGPVAMLRHLGVLPRCISSPASTRSRSRSTPPPPSTTANDQLLRRCSGGPV